MPPAPAIVGALSSSSLGLRFPFPLPLPLPFPFPCFVKGPKTMPVSPLRTIVASASESSPPRPWLLVGLGNPGKMYQRTRHNVGFEMVDAIAEAEGISVSRIQFKAMHGKGCIGDVPIMLAKPQTFMNVSGGHGGHNGMRSVISHLKGARDFPRLRIGIGRPPGKMEPANFVLRPFNKKEREELDFTFQNGVEAVRILVLEGFDKSATFVNSAQSSGLLNR